MIELKTEHGPLPTWYDVTGHGDPVVLLHPGFVDSRSMADTARGLAEDWKVFTPDRRGHGRTPDTALAWSYETMAADTIAFIEQAVGTPVRLVGCSDGAIVALLVTLARPDLVDRLGAVAAPFDRSGWVDGVLAADSNPPEFLRAHYGEVSPHGIDHFDTFAAKTTAVHAAGPSLTRQDLSGIRTRTLVMAADDDEVSLEHCLEMYRSLPNAELAIVPGTSHGLLVEKADLCNEILRDFLINEPVPTFAPIRRA